MSPKDRYVELSQKETLSLFVDPCWLDAILPSGQWDVLLAEHNGEIIGALPYQYKKKWGVKAITSPWMTPPQKLWIKGLPETPDRKGISIYHDVMQLLLSQMPSAQYYNFRIQSFPYSGHAWVWAGYMLFAKYSYLLDLTDSDKVIKSMKSTLRNEIRKCEQSIIVAKESDPMKFYNLLQQQVGYKYDLINDEMLEKLFALKNVFPFIASRDNKPIACTLFALDNNIMYYIIGARVDKKNNLGITASLWHIIKNYSGKGVTLDFEGSMIHGIEQYFRGFGGYTIPTINPVKKATWLSPFL